MMASYYQQLQFLLMSYTQASLLNPSLPNPFSPFFLPPTTPLPFFPSPPTTLPTPPPPDDPEHLDFTQGVLRCICGRFHRDELMVQCDACAVFQHSACMGGGVGGWEERRCTCVSCVSPTPPCMWGGSW